MSLFLVLLLAGCDTSDITVKSTVQATSTTEVSAYGEVLLEKITPPVFEEDFATLVMGNSSVPVYWGHSDSAFVWKESGYPGFDYPIVVEMGCLISETDTVSITTGWGVYDYRLVDTGYAFAESNNLKRKTDGKFLVNWGRLGEILIVWSRNDEKYCKYELSGGTKVVLEK